MMMMMMIQNLKNCNKLSYNIYYRSFHYSLINRADENFNNDDLKKIKITPDDEAKFKESLEKLKIISKKNKLEDSNKISKYKNITDVTKESNNVN
jgi:hypothetical protein